MTNHPDPSGAGKLRILQEDVMHPATAQEKRIALTKGQLVREFRKERYDLKHLQLRAIDPDEGTTFEVVGVELEINNEYNEVFLVLQHVEEEDP